jgi:pyruvate/2-oxoglutarate dehydrogenase complex dihydrolipoamide acyltransferase (E2) component
LAAAFANLVVVPPQVAIVGAGRAERRVVVDNDQQVIQRILPLSLTFEPEGNVRCWSKVNLKPQRYDLAA